jgi:hypothetical protein
MKIAKNDKTIQRISLIASPVEVGKLVVDTLDLLTPLPGGEHPSRGRILHKSCIWERERVKN